MTLGEKIKKARIENGLTQEQLADKMMVSRQAITKWEADKGIPDVSNLKVLSQLLNVSIDYLLDDGSTIDINVIREPIDISKYGKAFIKKKLTDKLMLEKYPTAQIKTLMPQKKLTKMEWILEYILMFFTFTCNFMQFYYSLTFLDREFYLVNQDSLQFLVIVHHKEGFVETRRMVETFNTRKGEKFTIGDIVYIDCGESKAHKKANSII